VAIGFAKTKKGADAIKKKARAGGDRKIKRAVAAARKPSARKYNPRRRHPRQPKKFDPSFPYHLTSRSYGGTPTPLRSEEATPLIEEQFHARVAEGEDPVRVLRGLQAVYKISMKSMADQFGVDLSLGRNPFYHYDLGRGGPIYTVFAEDQPSAEAKIIEMETIGSEVREFSMAGGMQSKREKPSWHRRPRRKVRRKRGDPYG
jgi:hypothetical protein